MKKRAHGLWVPVGSKPVYPFAKTDTQGMTPNRYVSGLTEAGGPQPNWTDERLVKACLEGEERAWSALILKYKDLIYSIPVKYRAPAQDVADIFQSVCLQLFSELPKLRKAESVRSWLITTAIRKSYQWKQKQQRWSDETPEEAEARTAIHLRNPAEARMQQTIVEESEREQMVREALGQLPKRCREMIDLLFFKEPPLPYSELAQRLGLASGSIGFIRGRCLQRLKKALEQMGFA